ncbi:MAG: L,D-transpeptidase [bacterium]
MSGTSKTFLAVTVCLLVLIGFSPVEAVEMKRGGPIQAPRVDRIVIGLKDFRLLAFSDGKVVFDYPIATGVDTGPTPKGTFRVVSRLKYPWYTPDDKPAQAPGADNPLGTRWIGINKPSYGLHGTNEPGSIGTRASEGCIRLLNTKVEQLYRHVPKGTRVIIKKRLDMDRKKLTKLPHSPPKKES